LDRGEEISGERKDRRKVSGQKCKKGMKRKRKKKREAAEKGAKGKNLVFKRGVGKKDGKTETCTHQTQSRSRNKEKQTARSPAAPSEWGKL